MLCKRFDMVVGRKSDMELIALIFSILGVVIGTARLVIEIIKLRANKKRINRHDANQDG